MAEKTADLDRLKDSLAELDRREAASEAKAAATERQTREAALDDKLAELGALGEQLADQVATCEPLLARVDEIEHEVVVLAGSLGRRFGDGDRRRPLFSRLAVGRLGVKAAAFYVSPADMARCEERLRTAPSVSPAPGQSQSSKAQRPAVPFAPGDPEQTRDYAAESTIAAQKKRAAAMTAGR